MSQPRFLKTMSAVVVILLGLAMSCSLLMAQSTVSGAISGVVTDASGAVVPSAKVEVKNTGTNDVTPLVSDEIGRYRALFQALRDVSHARDAMTNYSRSNDTQEHLAIVRPLAEGNAEAAAAAMDRHIRSVAQYLEEVLFGPRLASESLAER